MKHQPRRFDPVRGTTFGEVDKVANFLRTCDEVRKKVLRDGPWASTRRTFGEPSAPATTKLCAMCLEVKPFSAFTVDKRRVDGTTGYKQRCKECYNRRRRVG